MQGEVVISGWEWIKKKVTGMLPFIFTWEDTTCSLYTQSKSCSVDEKQNIKEAEHQGSRKSRIEQNLNSNFS